MPFALPVQLRETVQSIAREVLNPNSEKIDRLAEWPKENMRALQDSGLTGLVAPTEAGGYGKGLLSLAQACEILGGACPSTATCFGMHSVATAVLAARPTDDQFERFLIPIAKGKHLTSLALSEPGTGSHFYFPEASLEPNDDSSFLLNGRKSFVTNGSHVDSYVVSAAMRQNQGVIGSFSCVIVPSQSEGLHWGGPWNGLGMRGNSSLNLDLKNIRVEKRDLLGEEGSQLWYMFEIIAPYFLMGMAGTYLGISQDALNAAVNHLNSRAYSHSGMRLANLPLLQHRLGILWAQVERTRQLVYSAAAAADAKSTTSLPGILSAKAESSDCAVTVTNEVMTLLGGSGYAENSRIGQNLRDARASHVMAPTTDILRKWTARALLGLPLLGD